MGTRQLEYGIWRGVAVRAVTDSTAEASMAVTANTMYSSFSSSSSSHYIGQEKIVCS